MSKRIIHISSNPCLQPSTAALTAIIPKSAIGPPSLFPANSAPKWDNETTETTAKRVIAVKPPA